MYIDQVQGSPFLGVSPAQELCLTKTECSSWRCFGGKLVQATGWHNTTHVIDWNIFLLYPIHRQKPCIDIATEEFYKDILEQEDYIANRRSMLRRRAGLKARDPTAIWQSKCQPICEHCCIFSFGQNVTMHCLKKKDRFLCSGTCVYLRHTLCQIGCHPGSWGCTAPCCSGKSVHSFLYFLKK